MTETIFEKTINCVICKKEHPRRRSVKVMSTQLAAGLDCLTPEQRELFGLPTADEASRRATPHPPTMVARFGHPHEMFTIVFEDVRKKDHPEGSPVREEHFFQVIDEIGLERLPEFNYSRDVGTHKIEVQSQNVEFQLRTYTSPPGMFQVWMEALVHEPETEVMAVARLSWAEFSYPQANQDHERLVREIHEAENTVLSNHGDRD